jgi:hypothetical protein
MQYLGNAFLNEKVLSWIADLFRLEQAGMSLRFTP